MRFLSIATLCLSQLAYLASGAQYYAVNFCHGCDTSNPLLVSVSSSTVSQNVTVNYASCVSVPTVGESGDSYSFAATEVNGTHVMSSASGTVAEGDAWNMVVFTLTTDFSAIEQHTLSSGSITAPTAGQGTFVIGNFVDGSDAFTPAVNLSQVSGGVVTNTIQLTSSIASDDIYQDADTTANGYLVFSGSAKNQTDTSITVDIVVPDVTQDGAKAYNVTATPDMITYALLVGGIGASNDGAGYSLIVYQVSDSKNGTDLSSSSTGSSSSSESDSSSGSSDSESDSSSSGEDSSSSSSGDDGGNAFSTAAISPFVFLFASLAAALTIHM